MGQPPKVAVHNLSLVIEENECFGLLGANGAGKTTLISVLTGVYSATSGTARLAGHEITEDIAAVQVRRRQRRRTVRQCLLTA